ncbi:MAG: hypothetical protein U0175_35175 [Caldilineaceae bacterium]
MKAELKMHNGTPTVFLNDQPIFFGCHLVGYMYPDKLTQHQPYARRYAEAGVHIYSVDTLTHEWPGPRPDNPSPYDFSLVAPRMQSYIDVDPQAMFLLRMGFETRWAPNNWWNERYADEVEILSDGARWGQSFASRLWCEQVNDLIRNFIDHLRQCGLYDRVIGFQIGAGSSGEWIKDMSCMLLPTMDYSEPMRRHFRSWLRTHYREDVAALQRAWANDGITFENAEVPSFAEQSRTSKDHSFRDPALERNVIDFYECFAELCADDLIEFCQTVRQATGGERLVGGFFGYVLDLAWNMCFFAGNNTIEEASVSTMQRSGHLGLHRLLHSPHIDFLVSPYGYAFRGLGGDGLPMQPAESLRAHGKIYLMEEDTLMHNNFDPGGRNNRVENSIAIYQRNFAQAITHGHGVTWFETADLHEHDSLIEERQRWIKRFQELGSWALTLDRRPAAEVAVFLDDQSYNYESNRNNVDIPLIWRQRVVSLNRFGAPHDIYLLDDIFDKDFPDYKLYIFLNPFHLDNQRRAALKTILRQKGRTTLWLYGAGCLNSDLPAATHAERMADLTGFSFVQGDGPWGPLMHLTNFNHPMTAGLPQDWFWGSTQPIGPLFHVEDPEATTLGEIVYSLGRCKPGYAVKQFQQGDPAAAWTSIYMASPDIPAPILRGIARASGVHLYNEEGDVLYATPQLLSVHSVSGGKRRFKLPQSVEIVYDLFNQHPVAEQVDIFEVTLPPASPALYVGGAARGRGVLAGRLRTSCIRHKQ